MAVFSVTVLTGPLAVAQMQSITTTSQTSSAGTISAATPSTITVRSTSSPLPVRYTYTKTTSYVDENGNPVSVETVKSGAPVTVYYSQDGDRMIASKVVVRKSVNSDGTTSTTERTTTSSNGTVQSYGGDTIAVQNDEGAPVNYTSSRTTTYVDENGNTVSSETVKSGAPVTVYYTQDGDRMVASKVVVHNSSMSVQPDGSVIEHKKTTTTTTTTPNP